MVGVQTKFNYAWVSGQQEYISDGHFERERGMLISCTGSSKIERPHRPAPRRHAAVRDLPDVTREA